MWLKGVSDPGLVAAGLGSCILPSRECSGALPPCQLGGRGTNQTQPAGFVASWCHLLLIAPGRAVLGLPVQPAPLEQAGDNGREMPFPPQRWAPAAPWNRLSGRDQQHNTGRHWLILPAAGSSLPYPGWHPAPCQPAPGVPGRVPKAAARSW